MSETYTQRVTGAAWTNLMVQRRGLTIQNRGNATVSIYIGDDTPSGINAGSMRIRPSPNEPMVLNLTDTDAVWARVYSQFADKQSIVSWHETGVAMPVTLTYSPGVGEMTMTGYAPTVTVT